MLNLLRWALAAIGVVALSGAALAADCNGKFQPGFVCANPTGAVASPQQTPNPVLGSGSVGGSLSIVGDTLGAGAQALSVSATQPAIIAGGQDGVLFNITSAGSSSFPNRALRVIYNAGYSGSNNSVAISANNNAAGTGSSISTPSGNFAVSLSATGTTTGANFGGAANASGGNLNVGLLGLASVAKNSGTNIGGIFNALNTGTSPVQIGALATLNGAVPSVSGALIADNGATSSPIFIGMVNGVNVDSFNSSGLEFINLSTATALPIFSDTILSVAGPDGTGARMQIFDFDTNTGGIASSPTFSGLHANGTGAAPTAVVANDNLVSYSGGGCANTTCTTGNDWKEGKGGISVWSDGSTWTPTSQPTKVIIATKATGTTGQVTPAFAIMNDGGAYFGPFTNFIPNPGTASYGMGTINVSGPAPLAAGSLVLNITATQPATPLATQDAVLLTITGAGSASQNNEAMNVVYAAGYTGSSTTNAVAATNSNAGTGGTLSASGAAVGNAAGAFTTNGADTGYNFGVRGRGVNATVNFGAAGISNAAVNSGTNIGTMGMGINSGTTPVEIGGWFSLGQTTIPAVSAAFIADTAGENTQPIALFQVGQVTKASVNSTGGITATLTNVATTSAVCFNTGTLLFTYDGTIGTCNTSDERLKVFDRPMGRSLDKLAALSREEHFGYFYANAGGLQQFGTGEHIGMGAQTVARYFPELTARGSDGMMSLAYDKLTVPIIEAIAELKADNDNLRAEIKAIRSRRQ